MGDRLSTCDLREKSIVDDQSFVPADLATFSMSSNVKPRLDDSHTAPASTQTAPDSKYEP